MGLNCVGYSTDIMDVGMWCAVYMHKTLFMNEAFAETLTRPKWPRGFTQCIYQLHVQLQDSLVVTVVLT